MSQSQNDARLDELAGKVSALRGVTIDINRQAADHSFIDANAERFSNFSTSIKATANKLGRVASTNGFKWQLKASACVVGAVLALYFLWGLIF
ncbi:hypothetical protein BCR37DRAFT_395790 [Protomyces lactucae-debilis]|uniref:t-SNARE coiled-coil homology domain-containing protein n=1 Tax=Protomyces lactucae-debilis TaxID=2754530 RepID=A0A1Y2ES34_PROLT|nr:uncharacterized protein BCR37DRAFT_395790 [Protomyces lactucae-debilis]ORY74342.1 hypothetical protein BCR37DRAFT_395790 [Protomyces lactucae-debilis]